MGYLGIPLHLESSEEYPSIMDSDFELTGFELLEEFVETGAEESVETELNSPDDEFDAGSGWLDLSFTLLALSF